jgi:glutamate-ammonia-ligase adenylyltransferase
LSLLSFLDGQLPEVAQAAREADLPERARRNTIRLLTAMAGAPERFSTALKKPEVLKRALAAAGSSAYLTDLLVHHPEDLEVFSADAGEPPDGAATGQLDIGISPSALPEPYAWASERGLDFRERMAILRRNHRSRIVELGSQDLARGGSPFAMLRRWTMNAARCISSAQVIALDSCLNEKPALLEGEIPFVVLGMGRLGLSEFDLASDADLVFVAGSESSREDLQAWTHLAEKTIEVLSSYTREGAVFPVDTRLRPRGQEGDLVVTLDGLVNYLAEEAQAWELLTYLKAYPLAGNRQLGIDTAERLQAAIAHRLSSLPNFEDEIVQMRRRLEKEVTATGNNTKTAPGGYYDVDFALSSVRLLRGVTTPPGANTAEQIAALRAAGALSAGYAAELTQGAEFLRAVDHIVRLVTGKAHAALPENTAHAEIAESVAQRWGLIDPSETLPAKLRDTQQRLRYLYRRLVGSE